jgi:hypothetical protein
VTLNPETSSTTTRLPGGAGDPLRTSCHQSKNGYATEHNLESVPIRTCVTVWYSRYPMLRYGTVGTLCYGMVYYYLLRYGILGTSVRCVTLAIKVWQTRWSQTLRGIWIRYRTYVRVFNELFSV